eukprot:3626098-Pleurochrysis_carterae.AAC.1
MHQRVERIEDHGEGVTHSHSPKPAHHSRERRRFLIGEASAGQESSSIDCPTCSKHSPRSYFSPCQLSPFESLKRLRLRRADGWYCGGHLNEPVAGREHARALARIGALGAARGREEVLSNTVVRGGRLRESSSSESRFQLRLSWSHGFACEVASALVASYTECLHGRGKLWIKNHEIAEKTNPLHGRLAAFVGHHLGRQK